MTDAPHTLTAPMASFPEGSVVRLGLDRIVSSLTNPRKTFNEEKLSELAASIQTSGVHSPVLVRPLPGERLQDTFLNKQPGGALPEFEIVYGERRWRASRLAGVADVPVVIRYLTDDQVLDIQITENLQRDDLLPLEEAEGYQTLMDHSKLNVDQVAAKIGRSRGYVYSKLKLLDLCSAARDALRAGVIDTSKALLLARIPNESLQLKALATISEKNWGGSESRWSYREAAQMIQRDYMLRLDKARFKITDETLHPEAGACRSCVKRTGHEPDLFADVGSADVCTDPTCFHEKETLHDDGVAKSAKERGLEVIQGKEAKHAWPSSYNDQLVGYQRLDKPDHRTGESKKTLKKLLGKDCPEPILLQSPHNGELIEVVPKDKLNKLLKAKGLLSGPLARSSATMSEHEAKSKLEEKFEHTWRKRAVDAVFAEIQRGVGGLSYDVIRVLANETIGGLVDDDRQHAAQLLGLGKVASESSLREYVTKCEDIEAEHALLLFLLLHDRHWHSHSTDKTARRIELLGKEFAVDLKKIQATVKADLAPAPKAPEASLPLAPAAQASGVRGEKKKGKGKNGLAAPADETPKSSKEHAAAQIAEAMQALEGEEPGSADAPQRDEAVPVLRQAPAPAAMPAAVDIDEGSDSGSADAAQGDEGQAVLRQHAAAALPFFVGQAVQFKEGLRGPNRHMRKVCGRTGTIEEAGGNGYLVRIGPAAHQVAAATADEIVATESLPAPADGLVVHQLVKVGGNATRTGKPHAGRTGRITAKVGSSAWDVRLDPFGRKGAIACIFDSTELEVMAA